MEYTRLGRTGLKVSRLALGTMNFNPPMVSEPDCFRIMSRALEEGINLFDTADIYGFYYTDAERGLTETILGRWLAECPSRRSQIVLATKVHGETGPGPNDRGLSAYHIRSACEASLRRLQTDHIDLYQMHHIDRQTPWEEVWQAMELLVRQGKVSYVGSSNFAGFHIARAMETAQNRHFLGLASEQSLYNLMDRTVELEVIPACREYGLGLLPWSPLKAGLLAGILQKDPSQGRQPIEPWMGDALTQHRSQLEAYEAFCHELGEHPAHVALAWLLHNPVVTAPILGPRTEAHLSSSLRGLDICLSTEAFARLDAIWPGPGGEAPEAYAW